MKESFWGLFLVILGLIGVGVVNVLQTITTSNENNYYLLREVTEASMYDAVDLGYYRRTGDLKIIEEKFVENFTRRFAQTYGRNNTYHVGIYDIIEIPPKVSLLVLVNEDLRVYNFDSVDFGVNNVVDAILENKFPAAGEVITQTPSIPGVFTSPTSSTIFQNNANLNIKWGTTTSWGTPSTSKNYRLEVRCGDGNWNFLSNTASTSVTKMVSCASHTLQYRVRAESDGGMSTWRYSVIIRDFDPIALVPPTSYGYTGNVQQFVIPEQGRYKLEAWGAQGGYGAVNWDSGQSTAGGYGAYATGIITLNKGQVVYIYVGSSPGQSTSGGYNGGGSSYATSWKGYYTAGGGGGGATDFRTVGGAWNNAASLGSRVLVAGGGGGSVCCNYPYNGNGYNTSSYIWGSTTYPDAGQGSQTYYDNAGKASNYGDSNYYLLGGNGAPGTLGTGGNGGSSSYVVYSRYIYGIYGSGGGGGYYGGGGGAAGAVAPSYHSYYYGGSGGGGSSYTGGLKSPSSIQGSYTMPKASGGTETGHTGNGYAKITYLGPTE